MVTIGYIQQKGGVGKTTSAVNTAAILAARGKRVLLVDLDPQANSTGYFDMYDADRPSVYDVMIKSVTTQNGIRATSVPGLDLLPSVLDFSRADLELAQKLMRKEYTLKDALSKVADNYDFCILDCPPARNNVTINALTASDYAVLPTQPDHFAIESIVSMSDLLDMVKTGVNPGLKIMGILITMDDHTRNCRVYREALQAGELLPCLNTTIRKNTKLREAINAHQPINLYDANSTGARDYNALVDELLTLCK